AALHLAAPHVADIRHVHAAAGLLAVAATLLSFRRELLRSLRPGGLERPFQAPAPR
ncbi:MAG: hypothetical protein FJ104_15770, partial [Deltaproteobacteria bacterium]|nr:hypothetical protein [Deltaproteobacteria bacterium]